VPGLICAYTQACLTPGATVVRRRASCRGVDFRPFDTYFPHFHIL
jgi:hypothetical protein